MFSRIFKKEKKQHEVKISSAVRDYSKEPYFVKKAEAARAVLSRSVFPKDLLTT